MSGSSLIWRCRRGIREMDILLQNFLENYYKDLLPEEQNAFKQLLDEADLDIMNWVMGRQDPPSEEIAAIITKLQELNTP